MPGKQILQFHGGLFQLTDVHDISLCGDIEFDPEFPSGADSVHEIHFVGIIPEYLPGEGTDFVDFLL